MLIGTGRANHELTQYWNSTEAYIAGVGAVAMRGDFLEVLTSQLAVDRKALSIQAK